MKPQSKKISDKFAERTKPARMLAALTGLFRPEPDSIHPDRIRQLISESKAEHDDIVKLLREAQESRKNAEILLTSLVKK